LLPYFSDLFSVLLVFVVLYAILEVTKVLGGDSRGINSIVALCLALMLLLSKDMMSVVKIMTPWFVLLFIFIMFLLISFRWMGVSESAITSTMSVWKTPHYFLLAAGIIIFIAAIGSVYGNSLLPYTSQGGNVSDNQFTQNIGATFFNVKILGLVFLFMVGVFTILLLAGGPMVKK